MKLCDCEKWKKNVGIIDSALVLAFTHGARELIDVFEFCPWCGTKLADVEKDD